MTHHADFGVTTYQFTNGTKTFKASFANVVEARAWGREKGLTLCEDAPALTAETKQHPNNSKNDIVQVKFGGFGVQWAIILGAATRGRVLVRKWRAKSKRWTNPVAVDSAQVLQNVDITTAPYPVWRAATHSEFV